MGIKNMTIPQGTSYLKFKDFEDGEVVKFDGAYFKPDGRYGDEVGLTRGSQILRLPKRYNDFIKQIIDNPELYKELKEGVEFIINHQVSASGKVYGDISFA